MNTLISWSGMESSSGISLDGLHRKKKIVSTRDAEKFIQIWPAVEGHTIFLWAKAYLVFFDTIRSGVCSVLQDQWSCQISLLTCTTSQAQEEWLDVNLLRCWCPTTSRDSLLRYMWICNGIHIHLHQLNHLRSGLDVIKGIPIKLLILMNLWSTPCPDLWWSMFSWMDFSCHITKEQEINWARRFAERSKRNWQRRKRCCSFHVPQQSWWRLH